MKKIKVILDEDGFFVSELHGDFAEDALAVEVSATQGTLCNRHRFVAGEMVYVPEEVDHVLQWAVIRSRRSALLSRSDWTQLPDVPLATKEAWAVYRQALRDITEQTDPFNITWPAVPDQGG